ncbi:MAG: DUF2911 domain-containing protein [Chitinophagaceae bacterium]
MKKYFFVLLVACASQVLSYAQLKTPSPSPTQTIKQDFGLSNIELSYSRPGIKGRKVMGDLVPFGAIWRTGANQATTLTFGDEVVIGGTKIPAGKYGLLTIPGKDSWIIIISKQVDVTSPDAYKKESDVVRVTAKPVAIKDPVETFTLLFANVKATSCELHLNWETTHVVLPIKTEVDSKVMAQIEEAMKSDKPPYFAAASYYYDNGKDLKKAKEWAAKAVEAEPKAYYMVHLMAKIQAKQGDKAGAIATAKKSIELATEAKNNDYVKLNEKLIAGLK